MRNNLHITMNSFRFGSRILKETASLVRSGLVQHIYIAALHEEGLRVHEEIDQAREIWRARLRSRKWSRSLIVQIIKYVEFCVSVIRYARLKNIKVVNIHSLALLPLGVSLKWLCSAKLVYDAHELETETYELCGLRQIISRHVERILIKYADLVIVVGDSINEWYSGKYGLSNTVTVLNCPPFQEPQRTRRLHLELGISEERKILIYQGVLGRGRGIEKLLEAFAAYDDGHYVLVLMGYDGGLEPLIKEYAGSHNNIYFKEAVAPEVVLEYTASADVGISYIDNTSLNDHFCLPNKLFEYIMAGLPVIVNNVPEMRRIVTENQIGVVLDELTFKLLNQALEDISKMESETLSMNLRRVAKLSSWDNQENLMIDAYKQYI